MYSKGPILVMTSIGLLASAALLRLNYREPPPPDRISTIAGTPDPCARRDFGTMFARSGCDGPGERKAAAWQRRDRAGGAVFISVGDQE